MNGPDKQVQHGIDVVIFSSDTGEDTDIVIHLEFGEAVREEISKLKCERIERRNKIENLNRSKNRNIRGFRPGVQQQVHGLTPADVDEGKTFDDIEQDSLDRLLIAYTHLWRNVVFEGEYLECNRKNVTMIFKRYPWIKDQLKTPMLDLFTIEDVVASPLPETGGHVTAQNVRKDWGAQNRYFAEGNFKGASLAMDEYLSHSMMATPDHELRLRNGKFLPLWTGESVKNLAVIFSYGLGDSLLLGRYLSALCGHAERVIALVKRPMLTLFEKNAPAGVGVFDMQDSDCLLYADAHVYPWLLPDKTGLGICSANAAWITSENKLHDAITFPTTHAARVGIGWTGSTENVDNNLRSIPVERLAPLFEISGIEWHSLQADRRAIPPDGVIDHAHDLKNFMDTTKLIATLDLVIAIDSSVANLAASMGFPLWAMTERAGDSDFRWGAGGESTPWFPSARVFRQGNDRKWKSVVRRVAAALAEWKAARDYESRTRIVSAASQALNLGRSRCGPRDGKDEAVK
jgi:hypothetical protein